MHAEGVRFSPMVTSSASAAGWKPFPRILFPSWPAMREGRCRHGTFRDRASLLGATRGSIRERGRNHCVWLRFGI